MNATTLDLARTVADAVLYEGYLLYPYRSSSRKNQVRWQFGVLGPPGAAEAAVGEEPDLAVQCVLRPLAADPRVAVHVRFLQLQVRSVERVADAEGFVAVDELAVDGIAHLTWDEAVEREVPSGELAVSRLLEGVSMPVEVPGGTDVEELYDEAGGLAGRLVRRREPLAAVLTLTAVPDDGLVRIEAAVRNVGPIREGTRKQRYVRRSSGRTC
jgi:hypothetical protein